MSKRTWAYRVIDFGDHLALHEVHFVDGRPVSYSAGPATFLADRDEGLADILGGLELASADAKRWPVLPVATIGAP